MTENLEAEVKYHLRRRQEGAIFDPERAGEYTLLQLKDLAGVRVLAFPRAHLAELNEALLNAFPRWNRDPFPDDPYGALGYKRWGFHPVSEKVSGEYQIVSMLVGLFWEVEHSAIYKPIPELGGVDRKPSMRERTQEVLRSLTAFEAEFERIRNEAIS